MKTIKKAKYQGWLWHSDRTKPEVIDHVMEELSLDPNANPYIIEGQLWDEDEHRSVSVKFVDGEYLLNEFIVNDEECDQAQEFVPHRLPGVASVLMRQRWVQENDPNCCGMPIWVPAGKVFVGFNKKNQ